MVVEYEPIEDYYPDGSTIKQMADMDANTDDREALFDNCVSDEVQWEVFEEN
jgi:hypothetical protein